MSDQANVTNSVVDRVSQLVGSIVADLGLEIYDIEYSGGVLKITVDTPAGSPGGVDVDQLARCTRLVSRDLDEVDPIPGHYTLEVSSPGLERHLRLPRHFHREIGKTVAVRLRQAVSGERRITGVLESVTDEAFVVCLDSGESRLIPYAMVDRARTVFTWPAQPKSGVGSKGKKASKSKSPTSTADSEAENDDFDADELLDEDREHADS